MNNRPLRFCMITTFYPPYNFGGDGIVVSRLANALAKKGHHVEVIHCVDAYNLLSRDIKKAPPDHPDVKVHRLKSSFGPLSPIATQQTGYPFFKSKQIRKILDRGFDVIHYHNISLVGGPKILEYGKGIKLYTLHEYWLVCPTHMLFRFNKKPCLRPHCLLCSLVHKRPPQWWRYTGMIRSAVKHVDAFIAPSLFIADLHKKRGLELPITHIPNFITTSSVPGTANFDEAKDPYFLFVGRLEKLKGLQTIIPLFLKNRAARLLIAGTGNYDSYFKKKARRSDRIQFLGYISPDKLGSLYSNAMALILPSLWYENFGLVILEAFARKTPVITMNTGGAPELIIESGGGFIYNDENELNTAVNNLIQDPGLRNKLGEAGYRAFHDNWAEDAHLEKYFSLINKLAISPNHLNTGTV